ncbi:unnamed protein product [Prorocentrum cordatum]|uniref:SSD domain-containing protein n=1 Tax=Prorocentrum cordatum TaxID=2364126 RepID=A0ABN9RLU1_9DINO|nr:unnamed protein product [Polarella glacialis]
MAKDLEIMGPVRTTLRDPRTFATWATTTEVDPSAFGGRSWESGRQAFAHHASDGAGDGHPEQAFAHHDSNGEAFVHDASDGAGDGHPEGKRSRTTPPTGSEMGIQRASVRAPRLQRGRRRASRGQAFVHDASDGAGDGHPEGKRSRTTPPTGSEMGIRSKRSRSRPPTGLETGSHASDRARDGQPEGKRSCASDVAGDGHPESSLATTAGHEALVTWDEFRGLFAEPPRGPLSLDGSPKAWSHDGVAVEVRSRRSSQSSLRPSQSISPRAALTTYCRLSAQRPCSLVCVYTVILIILLAAFQREVIIKSDFSSFIRADGDCLRRMDAYSLALAERKRTSRRLAGSLVLERHLSLYYEPLDGGDVLNSRALREVKNFEAALTALPGWKRMCESRVPEPHQWLCTRGESLLSYVSADIVKAGESGAQWYSLVPDGQGIDMLSIPAVIAMMDHWTCVPSVFSNCEANLLDLHRFLPADFEAPAAGSAPAAAGGLKSAYVFRLKVTGLTDGSTQGSIMAEYEELFASEVYPFLTETPLQHVRVFFDGDTVEGHEVSLTLRNDAMWALGSTAMVLFFLWLHTRSVVVSLSVLLVMMLALPLAYVLTPVSITSASFLAIFLTIGIGSDVVFVFQDFWTQSEDQVQDEVRDKVCAPSFDARLIRRLELTLPAAFRNCLAAMSTTSASFLANMVSVLQPLREFGLYLGLCVMLAFLLLVLYMPPLMAWQERRRLPLEERRRLGGGEDLEKLSAIVPFEPGSAAAPETKLTPEPAVEPEPDAEPRPQHRSSRRPGLTSRLFRRLPVSIVLRVQRCPVAVVVVWTLCVLTFCILTGINMDVAKGVPDFFPKGHNQREIARMMDMFVSTEPLGLSISPPSSLRVCEAEPPSSALSQSYCDLHWCRRDAAGAPPDLVTAGGIGQCRTRLVGGQTLAVDESRWDFSSCSQVAVSGRAVSFFQNASESWAAFWESAASSMVGISSVSVSSVPGSDLPPLVLESWVSGSVDIAHLVRMPSYGVMLSLAEPGSESCVLEALCSFGVPPCEQDDGWLHLVEGCADFNGSYFDGAATMWIQQAATCTFTGTWQGSALSGSIAGGTMTIMEHPWGTNVVVGQLVGGSDIELSSGHLPGWARGGWGPPRRRRRRGSARPSRGMWRTSRRCMGGRCPCPRRRRFRQASGSPSRSSGASARRGARRSWGRWRRRRSGASTLRSTPVTPGRSGRCTPCASRRTSRASWPSCQERRGATASRRSSSSTSGAGLRGSPPGPSGPTSTSSGGATC